MEEIIFRVGVQTGDSSKDVNEVTKDISQLDAAVVDLNKDMAAASKVVQKSFEEIVTGSGTASQKFKELNDAIAETPITLNGLNAQMEAYKAIALQVGATDPIGQESLKRAADLKRQYTELERSVDNLAVKGGNLQAALQLGETVVAGYGAVQGITALVGQESEELTQTLVKLNAVQSLLASTEQIRAALEKESILRTKAMALAQQAYTIVVGESTGALKLMRIALAATGIGALIAIIATVIANWDEWTGSINRSAIAQEGLNDTIDDYKQGAQDAANQTNQVAAAFDLAREGVISKEEALATYNEQLGDTFGKATDLNEAERLFSEKTGDYIKAAAARAQANALLEKAAEEQANALAAAMEDQTTFGDKLSASFTSSTEQMRKELAKSQKQRVKEAKAEADQRAEIFNQEAQRLLKEAEMIDNNNGIASEFDKQRLADQKKAAEERQKLREQEAQRIKEENERIAAEQRNLQRQITDATIAAIEDRETRERMALAEKHRRELEDLRIQYGERAELIRSLEERQALEQRALEKQLIEADEAELEAARKRRDEQRASEAESQSQFSNLLLNQLKKASEEQIKIDEALAESKRNLAGNIATVFGTLASMSQDNSARQKAFALAEIAIQTATGFMDGLRLAQKAALETPTPIGKALVFGSFAASQFAAVLNTAKKVKSIIGAGASVSPPTAMSSSGGSGASATLAENGTTDTSTLNQPQQNTVVPVLIMPSLKQAEAQYNNSQELATYP